MVAISKAPPYFGVSILVCADAEPAASARPSAPAPASSRSVFVFISFFSLLNALTVAHARIEQIAQRVAEHVDAEDDQRQADARRQRHPRREIHVVARRAGEHAAPGG